MRNIDLNGQEIDISKQTVRNPKIAEIIKNIERTTQWITNNSKKQTNQS